MKNWTDFFFMVFISCVALCIVLIEIWAIVEAFPYMTKEPLLFAVGVVMCVGLDALIMSIFTLH